MTAFLPFFFFAEINFLARGIKKSAGLVIKNCFADLGQFRIF